MTTAEQSNLKRFTYSKTFIVGFGFLGISIIWPIFFLPLSSTKSLRLHLASSGTALVLDSIGKYGAASFYFLVSTTPFSDAPAFDLSNCLAVISR